MTNIIAVDIIVARILKIRGKGIILDKDLAKLYGIETKALLQAVRRNMSRFPGDFMYQLTKQENPKLEVTNCDLKLGR